MKALIETTGSGRFMGVWLAGADHGAPDVAFHDEGEQVSAEVTLAEAFPLVAAGQVTWDDVLDGLYERANQITVARVKLDWPGSDVAELLTAATAFAANDRPWIEFGPPLS